ncbi:MAG: hypothetical protein AABY07_05455 [Nanoarchaeota archaeon]
MPTKKYQFECEKCHRRYRTEVRFLSHICQELKQSDLVSIQKGLEARLEGKVTPLKQVQDELLLKESNRQLEMANVTKCFSCTWYTTSSEFSGLTDVSIEHLGNCEGPVIAASRLDKIIVIITKPNGEYNTKTLVTSKYEPKY